MHMDDQRHTNVRVLIADDDFDMRLLVRATLGADDRIDVVAEAEDGTVALEEFRRAQPDVCVLDYRMPGLTGLEVAQQILEEQPGARILLFSAFLTPELSESAKELGVACLRKDQFMRLPDALLRLAEVS